jgi:hypothetical protein
MNDFDQAGRFQLKSYPQAHLDWLFPITARVMCWSRWLDSQSAPRTGEPDRRIAASLALTFSQLTKSRPVWKPVLESLHMNESIVFREVRTEARNQGRLETRRETLTRVLQTKLSGDALERATARVESQDNLKVLSRWFDLALTLSPEALVAELDR